MTQEFLAEFVDGGPGCCRDDCMITSTSSVTTAAYYPPVTTKDGLIANPDMNITTTNQRCLSCGKKWTEQWQNGTKIM
jgi:hypothetical protein